MKKTILYQGDSITDCGRNREREGSLGTGYAFMTSGKISVDYPGQYTFINKGISGNRVVDLYARIKKDAINLQPDIMTVLIGVNDVWHEFEKQNGVSNEKYAKFLEMFLCEVMESCPQTKIFLLEPFVLPGTANQEFYEAFHHEVRLRAASCKAVAKKLNLPFIPLQEDMEYRASLSKAADVLGDGVHPTCCGHELISRKLYAALKEIL